MHDYFQSLIANCASEWRPVVDFEGLYEASCRGEVRSIDRKVPHPLVKNQTVKGRLIKQCLRNGYMAVGLSKQGDSRPHSVHRVVVEAHFGRIPLGMYVDHRNGTKTDNRLENLRIVTPKQNSRNSTVAMSANGNRGVTYCNNKNRRKKWRAVIRLGEKRQHLGNFTTLEEAVAARLAAETKYWGSDAPSEVRK